MSKLLKNVIKALYTTTLCRKFLIGMSLTPPKRLFDVESMKTVMYDDVKSDVEKNGYIHTSFLKKTHE